MTILVAVQNACAQLNLEVPTVVFASLEPDIVSMRTLANVEASELLRRHDWQAQRKENAYLTVATETQTGIFPSDYNRMINGTFQNRTLNRPVWGPLTPQEWQREKALPIYTSPNYAFIERSGAILFTPTPTAGNAVYFEYISKNIVTDVALAAKEYFTADTDTFNLDEKMIELGLIWRFKASKGLNYTQEFQTYENMVNNQTGQEQPSPTISLDGRSPRYMLGSPTIKEGSWP